MSKLEERCKQYKIPDPPYLPFGDEVLIYQLPPDEKTASGLLFVPQGNQVEPDDRGVLVAAGLGARDVLADHLAEVGDIVWFGHFDGDAKTAARKTGETTVKLLQMRVSAIRGSEDGQDRLPDYEIVRDPETGEHRYEKKTSKRKAA